MSNSAETFDSWPREELRLFSGFLCIAFAVLFWWFFSNHIAASSAARLIVYALVGASLLLGVGLVLFRRLVVIDPVHRQASRVVLLHRIVVHKTSWPLESFRCIFARHGTDEGSHFASVGLMHSSGTEVWLRSFQSPPVGLSEEAAAFVSHLSETTGLRYEERTD
jgi:hypothetical protein